MKCPHCEKQLRIKIEKGTDRKPQPQKPDEEMCVDIFIKKCRESKRREVNIIGEYADELNLNGEYNTRLQWNEFFKRNIKPAQRLAPFTNDQIGDAMAEVRKNLKENGGYIDKFTLETIYKFLVK